MPEELEDSDGEEVSDVNTIGNKITIHRTIIHILKFIIESEAKVSLENILSFTGGDCVPPLGFESAVLNFNATNPYPTSSTCAIHLTLPRLLRI